MVDLLHDLTSEVGGDNALVLFLRVLSDNVSPGDACRQQLASLADEWEQVVKQAVAVPPSLPSRAQGDL